MVINIENLMREAAKKITAEVNKGHILVSDGAWGTRLIEAGLSPGACPEEWCISRPQDVYNIGYEYVQAGARIIGTNSFGANRFKLENYGFQNRVEEFNLQAAILSRRAAGNNHYVAGSVGPCGKLLITGEITRSEMFEAFSEQVRALEKGRVDAICIETMSSLDEACIAVEAAKKNTGLEVICTFVFTKTVNAEYKTIMGVSCEQMTEVLVGAGADIIGANCGGGSEQMVEVVKEIRKVSKDIPVIIQPNAGAPVFKNKTTFYPESPEFMAGYVPLLIEAGANIIGGCCGTTPAHIKAIVMAAGDRYARK